MNDKTIAKCEKVKARMDDGESYTAACKNVGLAPATYRKWRNSQRTAKARAAKAKKVIAPDLAFEFTPAQSSPQVAVILVKPADLKETLRQLWQ